MSDEDYIDVSEQSKDWQFATQQTLAKVRQDIIQKWVEDNLLNSVLEDAAMEIRKAVSYLRSDVSVKILDYKSIDVPNGRSNFVDEVDEPAYVRKYLRWSREIMRRFGYRDLNHVINCIVDGDHMDYTKFEDIIKLYE